MKENRLCLMAFKKNIGIYLFLQLKATNKFIFVTKLIGNTLLPLDISTSLPEYPL